MLAITTAEGYLELGMFEDAWAATEGLPPEERTAPLVLELRLRVLTAMEKWDLGEHLASLVTKSEVKPKKCRKTVARFRHAFARHLGESGETDRAKAQVKLAVETWNPIRAEIVEDDGLEGAW